MVTTPVAARPGPAMLALAVAMALSGGTAAAQALRPSAIVRVGFEGPACGGAAGSTPCVVVVEADGPLPEPSGASLKNPDRIYLDFPGVRATTSGLPRGDASRPGIRVAVHSDAPLVTRVVVDLTAPASYTVNGADRAHGRVRLQLTGVHGAAAPAARTPRTPRSYGERLKAIVDALEPVRVHLALLDHQSMPDANLVRSDTAQIAAAREALAAIKPPATLAAAHAQLVSACGLAAMAFASAATDPGGKVAPETATAAAGALILLDRARAALSSVQ